MLHGVLYTTGGRGDRFCPALDAADRRAALGPTRSASGAPPAARRRAIVGRGRRYLDRWVRDEPALLYFTTRLTALVPRFRRPGRRARIPSFGQDGIRRSDLSKKRKEKKKKNQQQQRMNEKSRKSDRRCRPVAY